MAENMLFKGSTSALMRTRTSLAAPRMPTKNAPNASENWKRKAMKLTKKQMPRMRSSNTSSSCRREIVLRSRGTSTMPNTITATKKSPSPPMLMATLPTCMPEPAATPVMSATMPTVTISSHTLVPSVKLTNARVRQPSSSIILASMVVAESHTAAPRKRLCTIPQPKIRVPTV